MNTSSLMILFNDALNKAVNAKFNAKLDELREVLSVVCAASTDGSKITESILDNLIAAQRYPVRTVIRLIPPKKTRTKKEIDPNTRCMARIGLGTQCSRSRIGEGEYCRSHIAAIPYGRVDSESPTEPMLIKKRGRHGRNKQTTVSEADLDKYVSAIRIDIGGQYYLLDQHNVLYKFTPDNEIVGYMELDDVHWY